MPKPHHWSPILTRWRNEIADQARLALHLLRWIALGMLSGVLAGIASWVFLEGLDWVTRRACSTSG